MEGRGSPIAYYRFDSAEVVGGLLQGVTGHNHDPNHFVSAMPILQDAPLHAAAAGNG